MTERCLDILKQINQRRETFNKPAFVEIRIYKIIFQKNAIQNLLYDTPLERSEKLAKFPQGFAMEEKLIASSNW